MTAAPAMSPGAPNVGDGPLSPDPAVENVPVNVAPPNWQCPHCRKTFRGDFATATACAQAGPAPEAPEGIPVLAFGTRASDAVFGLTKAGPVVAVKSQETGMPHRHERAFVVSGQRFDPTAVMSAAEAHDQLRVIPQRDDAHRETSTARPNLASYSTMYKLFRYGQNAPTGHVEAPVWIDEYHGPDRGPRWWVTPDPQQRAALNVVTDGLLERICEADEDVMLERVRARYSIAAHPGGRIHLTPQHMASPRAGLCIADAHGATNAIWAMRWLLAHFEAVTTWHVQAVKAWAAGRDEGQPSPVAIPAVWLSAAESLPRSPGKRRLAVMEPYGFDYRQVLKVVLNQLGTDDPQFPVPGVADASSTLRGTVQLSRTAGNGGPTSMEESQDA